MPVNQNMLKYLSLALSWRKFNSNFITIYITNRFCFQDMHAARSIFFCMLCRWYWGFRYSTDQLLHALCWNLPKLNNKWKSILLKQTFKLYCSIYFFTNLHFVFSYFHLSRLNFEIINSKIHFIFRNRIKII